MDRDQPNRSLSSRLGVLRGLVIEASLEVLDRDGLGLGTDAITYARVFAHLEDEHGVHVTRGSVHERIWASHEDFRDEVLAAAAGYSSPFDDGRCLHESVVHVLRMVDQPDLCQQDRVRAFCRIAGQGLFDAYLESDRFRRFQVIKAVARSGSATGPNSMLRSMVGKIANGNLEARAKTFAFLFEALGLRARRDLGLDENDAIRVFMTMVQMLVTGAHLDHHGGFTAMASPVETDLPADEGWPWTPFGLGFLAGMNLLFEPDPDAASKSIDDEDALHDVGPAIPAGERPCLAELAAGRPRRSREELRGLVVAAAVDLLLRDGISLTADSLTYASVFAHIKQTRGLTINRSSVHRHIWDSQDDFRADVLAQAARYHTGELLGSARQAMAQTVIHAPDGSPNVRQRVLDSTRAVVSAQMMVSAGSPSFRRWQSIKALMLAPRSDEQFDDLRRAVNDRYEELVSASIDTYRSVLPLVDLRVDPELGMSEEQAYRLFAVVGAAFAAGADFNISAGAIDAGWTVPLPRVDGSGGSDDWPIQALASLAMLDLLFVSADAS